MPAIYTYNHTVQPDEIDGQGHVNNVEYVRWMQHVAVAHSAAQGWDGPRYREHDCGFVARSHFIEYLQPAFAGDELLIRTWVTDFQKTTSTRKYQILRPADDLLVARAETKWAFVSLSTRRPQRIPPLIRESFVMVPAEQEP